MSNQDQQSPIVPVAVEAFEAAAGGQATAPASQEEPYKQQQHSLAHTWSSQPVARRSPGRTILEDPILLGPVRKG